MERLTTRMYGQPLMALDHEEKHTMDEWVDMLQVRLCEYEDTGLSPKQVKGLRAGALRSDKTMHKAYNTALTRRYYGATCPRCGGLLGVAYHEDRLYSVKCDKCEILTLVEARTPCDAQYKAGGIRQGGLDTTEPRP